MPTLTEPWIYAWPQSVVPGETVALRAAGPSCEGRVQIARIGLEREVVWRGTIEVDPHDLTAVSSTTSGSSGHSARWQYTLAVRGHVSLAFSTSGDDPTGTHNT